jgi:hypothetical protein
VARASYWWKQIRYLSQDLSIRQVENTLVRFFFSVKVRKTSKWMLTSFVVTIALAWNWKLVLATGSGAGFMLLVYSMQEWNWQAYISNWRQFFTGSQGKLTVAVGSGGLAALGTYIAASIWAESENRWLATGTILQGFGTLITLLLLGWHIVRDRAEQDEVRFERLLQDLTATESLKRLIAIQQLATLANKPRLRQIYQPQLVEYFSLMLSTEEDAIVREAILRNLQKWGKNLPSERPAPIPLNLQNSPKRVLRMMNYES